MFAEVKVSKSEICRCGLSFEITFRSVLCMHSSYLEIWTLPFWGKSRIWLWMFASKMKYVGESLNLLVSQLFALLTLSNFCKYAFWLKILQKYLNVVENLKEKWVEGLCTRFCTSNCTLSVATVTPNLKILVWKWGVSKWANL